MAYSDSFQWTTLQVCKGSRCPYDSLTNHALKKEKALNIKDDGVLLYNK